MRERENITVKIGATKPHFWASDQETAVLRRSIIIHWIRSSITIWILTFLIILIYLGGGVDPLWYTCSIDVFVTDFDQGLVGTYFIDLFDTDQSDCDNQNLNWIFRTSINQSIDFIQQIEQEHAWAAVSINNGTTARLNNIIQTIIDGNASYQSYDSLPAAVTIIYDEGRNFNTINNFILPRIQKAISQVNTRYSSHLQSQIISDSSNTTQNTLIASIIFADIIYNPLHAEQFNLHPAQPFPSFLATTLGYLILWLVMLNVVHMIVRLTQPMIENVSILRTILTRLFLTLINCLILSLVYSLVVLWLSNFTHPVSFIHFWLFNWLATLTFTAIIGLFMIHLGPIAQIFLPLFLVINLAASSSNLAIELQHPFYRIAYGLPLYHCFTAGRHFLFGSHTQLNIDIAVLFTYYLSATIVTILVSIYQYRTCQIRK